MERFDITSPGTLLVIAIVVLILLAAIIWGKFRDFVNRILTRSLIFFVLFVIVLIVAQAHQYRGDVPAAMREVFGNLAQFDGELFGLIVLSLIGSGLLLLMQGRR